VFIWSLWWQIFFTDESAGNIAQKGIDIGIGVAGLPGHDAKIWEPLVEATGYEVETKEKQILGGNLFSRHDAEESEGWLR